MLTLEEVASGFLSEGCLKIIMANGKDTLQRVAISSTQTKKLTIAVLVVNCVGL